MRWTEKCAKNSVSTSSGYPLCYYRYVLLGCRALFHGEISYLINDCLNHMLVTFIGKLTDFLHRSRQLWPVVMNYCELQQERERERERER